MTDKNADTATPSAVADAVQTDHIASHVPETDKSAQ
jgi:hypothetical protein